MKKNKIFKILIMMLGLSLLLPVISIILWLIFDIFFWDYPTLNWKILDFKVVFLWIFIISVFINIIISYFAFNLIKIKNIVKISLAIITPFSFIIIINIFNLLRM